jgi:alanine-glyoxylate transaminase/serine-glyoxylate transaminase/serine-pyruvate transaminase
MAGRNFLFVPGPTNVPDRILSAMHRPMDDHRSSAFPALVRPILERLKAVVQTRTGQAFVFPATGTAMWETALVNTLSPGDRLLSPRYGQFGHLFIECARRLGMRVDVIQTPWGEGAPAERIAEALRADTRHEIAGVLVVHNETSTGVTSDLAAVRRAIDGARHPALLYVDGVSAVASLPVDMDGWGIDVVTSGSQKGFMLPPGLGIIYMSPRAMARFDTAKCPRAFFDLRDMQKSNATGYFPYTPPISLLYGLRESLDMLLEEGLDNVYARHHRLAEGCRRAVAAWGLSLCAKDPHRRSDTVSAVMVPAGTNGADIVSTAFTRYNLALGAGLGDVAGKLFRIGHLGDINELMLLGALAGVEMTLQDVGVKVTPGSGVAAAEEYFRSFGNHP